MSFVEATRSVERQTFFDGQRLFAADLQALEGFNREMRWLHNRSLHQPGIGNGFAVSGRKGDRQVIVGPGYAIDDIGHEIVLTSSRTIPVPPVAGNFTSDEVRTNLGRATIAGGDRGPPTACRRCGFCGRNNERWATRLRPTCG